MSNLYAGALEISGAATLGSLNVIGSTSNAGKMFVSGNFSAGQNLGSPNVFTAINQWLTSSWKSSVTTSGSTSMQINAPGSYLHITNMSFSGSAGVYTFAKFENGYPDPDCMVQTTIANGQPFPVNVTLSDVDMYNTSDVVDIRVKSNNAGANFQLNFGNFMMLKVF